MTVPESQAASDPEPSTASEHEPSREEKNAPAGRRKEEDAQRFEGHEDPEATIDPDEVRGEPKRTRRRS